MASSTPLLAPLSLASPKAGFERNCTTTHSHFTIQQSPHPWNICATEKTTLHRLHHCLFSLLAMEDGRPLLPPCKLCSPSDTGAEKERPEQACCDSMIAASFRATKTKTNMFATGACLELAAQQECDAQCGGHCNDSETTENDLKGRRKSPQHTQSSSLTADRCAKLDGDRQKPVQEAPQGRARAVCSDPASNRLYMQSSHRT